jgi:hypothetical protein
MKRTFLWVVVIIIIIVGGFYVLNGYIYNAKQTLVEVTPESKYFQERLVTLGVQDIGQPIEGFDAPLLIMAFPGLVPSDFNEVETLEGKYVLQGEGFIFVRTQEQPISSAEQMVSEKGYSTLLLNVSKRLNVPVTSEDEIDELITKLNTSERIETRINQGGSALNVTVTPLTVIEDSRCPANANCIQAGTVRIRAILESGLGSAPHTFELDNPITTEAEEVTLVRVEPASQAGVKINNSEYIFYFEVKKR